ncbi:MAG: hypothetical protein K8S13_23450, partial [Desulfobacula sp.]|uniref:uracil-DNA glycosylase family protein n=1 Tax=Desulfobacula sp. TaxID=2593537 RepID=UPI0025C63CD3
SGVNGLPRREIITYPYIVVEIMDRLSCNICLSQVSIHMRLTITNRNSGIKFRIQIKKMGFDLSNDFYVTNTVKCFTPGLTPEEKIKVKNNCIVHLMQEIEMIQPELIVCVGGTALEAIYDQILKKKPPGVKISIEGGAKKVDGYHVATMLHPSWYDYWSRKWEWTEKNYLNDSRSILLQYSKK